jgi:dihydrofolate reductase
MPAPVRVFIACSLDEFIAGPGDDLSWLPQDPSVDRGYDAFMAGTGAILMGRATYEVVAGFSGPWPYGDVPVLVATTRALDPAAPTVRAVRGDAAGLVAQAREAARGRGVYLDGGHLIRQALDAGLVDELTVTVVPVILGAGAPLFAGARERRALRLAEHRVFDDGLVQLRYLPAP